MESHNIPRQSGSFRHVGNQTYELYCSDGRRKQISAGNNININICRMRLKFQLLYFTMTPWFVYMNKNRSNLSEIVFPLSHFGLYLNI